MKDFLALMGFVFVILLAVAAILFVYLFSDQLMPGLSGLVNLPEIQVIPAGTPTVYVIKPPAAIVPAKPTSTLIPIAPTYTPAPTPTPTQIPDPVAYRTEVTIRARNFGTVMDAFQTLNGQAQKNQAVVNDPTWRSQVEATLDEFVLAAQALGEVGPVPPEYLAIDGWLKKIGPEAAAMRENYLNAIQTGDQQYTRAAGDNMNAIIDDINQAHLEMVKTGWQ